jgi:hypothetical protein
MAKLEQKARKGLYGGFKPGSTGGPGTGKLKNTVKRVTANLKRAVGDVASNVKDKIETRKTEKATEELAAMGSSKNPRFLQDASNPVQNAAMTAGGSRPMTAMNNPQIDPITGMPITAGGQANMNPNFIGGMANSNIPTTAMLAQENIENKMLEEKYREELINTHEGKRINEALGVNYTPNPNPAENYNKGFEPFGRLSGQAKSISSRKINGATVLGGNQPTKQSGLGAVIPDQFKAKTPQEKKMMRTMKPLVKLNPSETYSSYKDFRGNMQKATIDDSTFTSDSIKFKSGINPKYKLDMNKSYNYNLENNPKAVEFSERMTPEINQSRRSTKCMRVKKR